MGHFARAGVPFPPAELTWIGLKEERQLEIWARDAADAPWRFVHAYPVLAASGSAGPKLREGDYQVPEGSYRVIGLNPNSAFHLSLKLDYPNEWDKARGSTGTDIFIHGNAVSAGCLAMGDGVAEELFYMGATLGGSKVTVLLAPWDLRHRSAPTGANLPVWASDLYTELARKLSDFSR